MTGSKEPDWDSYRETYRLAGVIIIGATVLVVAIGVIGALTFESPCPRQIVENTTLCDEFLTMHNVTSCNSLTMFQPGNLQCVETIRHASGGWEACNIQCVKT